MYFYFYRAIAMQARSFYEHLSVRPSVRLSNAWIVTKRKHLAKNLNYDYNRELITSFPMSLRWTAYVAPNPPKGASKAIFFFIFRIKMGFSLRKSETFCYKVSLCENFQRQSVKHSLAYLTVHKWLVGNAPLYLKFSTKVIHPLQKPLLAFQWA